MAAAKKKSFKEEMEELLAFKAAPASLDPEGWGSEGARLDSSDDELYEEGRKGREVSRMRGVIDMGDDAAYVGRRASREAFFRAEQGKGRGDRGDERRNDTDTDTDTDGDGDGDDEGDGLEDTKDQGVYSGGEGEEEDDDDDEEDDDGRDNRDNRDDEDDELSVLEREMLEAERAEAQAVEEMKDRQAKELEKAKAVKAQKKLWQSGLEARIMMQKVMHGANKLPLPDVYRGLGDVDSILAQEMAGVAADARRTLGDLCDVLDAVGEVNPSIATAKSKSKSKSKRVREDDGLEACWAALDGRYASFGVFRDSSLDRWHRKTMIESGGVGSSSASNMRVLNQGISKQVALLMKDVDRMAERSQMRTGEFQGLCRVGGETDTNRQVRRYVGIYGGVLGLSPTDKKWFGNMDPNFARRGDVRPGPIPKAKNYEPR